MVTTTNKSLGLDDFPSPPAVALKLLELYSSDSAGVDELVEAISIDPVLSARVIAYCNSPTMGLRHEAKTLRHAVVNLGSRIVKTISLSFSLTDFKVDEDAGDFDLDRFWNRSLATAVATQKLCAITGENGEVGFLQGLLLNVGEMGQVILQNKQNACEELLEAGPYNLSAKLLTEWKLPTEVISAITALSEDIDNKLTHTLKSAIGIAEIIFNGDIKIEAIQEIKEYAEQQLAIPLEVFEVLFEQIVEAWVEYARLLDYDCTHVSLEDIEAEARKQMTFMTLSLQRENSMINAENQCLREKAHVDPLTELGNRHAFDERATAEWDRSHRSRQPFALMIADIDHFKQINDVNGHTIGDHVLKHVATLLRKNCRKYDHVYRFGGEEFVLIFPECDLPTSKMIAQRIVNNVAESPYNGDGFSINATISIGIGYSDPDMMLTLPELIDSADEHLYVAKNRGRNQYSPV